MPNDVIAMLPVGRFLIALGPIEPGPAIDRGGFIAEPSFWAGNGRLWHVVGIRIPGTSLAVFLSNDKRTARTN